VIGRRCLPEHYRQWNRYWGAPLGKQPPGWATRAYTPRVLVDRSRGPFAFQPNNLTRVWEYPWAFHAIPLHPGMRAVELGGALSGLQFVLAKAGVRVVNVDPFVDYGVAGEYAGVDPLRRIRQLNRSFGTDVEVRRCGLPDAAIDADSLDALYCVSTLEHLGADDVAATLAQARRALRPGGHLVATVDLFLDLEPFTSEHRNTWGTNIDIRHLVADSGLKLVAGEPAELLGFVDFDTEAIRSNLAHYLVGNYPGLAQCFVLRKD
jgi:SAM-dependent methyltransferase